MLGQSAISEVPLDWLVDLVNEFSTETRRAANETHIAPERPQSAGPRLADDLDSQELAEAADAWFEVFRAGDSADEQALLLDRMLRSAEPIVRITTDNGPVRQQLVPDRRAEPVDQLIAAGALTLLDAISEPKPRPLGTCHADRCCDVFVDSSPRRDRSFCCLRCQTRTRVRRHRTPTPMPTH